MVNLGYFQGIARIRCLQLFASPGSFKEFLISGNQPCNPPTADIRQINSGVKLLLKGSKKALHALIIRLGYLEFTNDILLPLWAGGLLFSQPSRMLKPLESSQDRQRLSEPLCAALMAAGASACCGASAPCPSITRPMRSRASSRGLNSLSPAGRRSPMRDSSLSVHYAWLAQTLQCALQARVQ